MDWFESISPLLLLIVWAILAAAANQKKKQARREQAPTSPQTGKPVQPQNQNDNPVETLMEKLRRGLQEISEEGTGRPSPGGPRSDPLEPKRRTSPPPLPESTEDRMRRAEEQQGEKRRQLRQREKPKYTRTPDYAPIETLTSTQDSATTSVLSDAYSIAAGVGKGLPSSDLQKGIIWMEILQPPVSLRD